MTIWNHPTEQEARSQNISALPNDEIFPPLIVSLFAHATEPCKSNGFLSWGLPDAGVLRRSEAGGARSNLWTSVERYTKTVLREGPPLVGLDCFSEARCHVKPNSKRWKKVELSTLEILNSNDVEMLAGSGHTNVMQAKQKSCPDGFLRAVYVVLTRMQRRRSAGRRRCLCHFWRIARFVLSRNDCFTRLHK